MLIEAGWLLEELTCMYINAINHQVKRIWLNLLVFTQHLHFKLPTCSGGCVRWGPVHRPVLNCKNVTHTSYSCK